MGIAERKEREKARRRNMILDAAERLYFGQGIEATTMDDVAEEAELSKGTLYLYFKNKDDLSHGIYLRGLTALKSFFQEAIDSRERGIEKVRAIGEAYFRFSREHTDYFNSMMQLRPHEIDFSDPTTNGMRCHQCGEEVMAIVARAVQIGIDDGTIRPELDPMKTAFTLWGQSAGIIQILSAQGEHLQSYHGISAEELMRHSFDMIYHALRA
ncbi:MAG: TetR/AcrR family transcriptional regulator [Calditrichaeota bacterium]|nr:TetR/AcrR family transcriptional regulator [Calditrichota bacterium]